MADREEPAALHLPQLNRNLEMFGSALVGVPVTVHVMQAESIGLQTAGHPEPRVVVQLPSDMLAGRRGSLPPMELRVLLLRGLGRLLYGSDEPLGLQGAALAAWRILEDGRVEARLRRRFAGAERVLQPGVDEARSAAEGHPGADRFLPELAALPSREHAARLLAVLYLEAGEAGGAYANLPPSLAERVARLTPSLRAALDEPDPSALARWVRSALLPHLAEPFVLPGGDGAAGEAVSDSAALGSTAEETATSSLSTEAEGREGEGTGRRPPDGAKNVTNGTGDPGTAGDDPDTNAQGEDRGPPATPGARLNVLGGGGSTSAAGVALRPITYPRVGGGVVVDQLAVAHGSSVAENERSREVLRDVSQLYGPLALAAFAGVAESLRQAFVVNHEMRFGGRYRAGRRVGIVNLRRYQVSRDLRLFQKLEVPDRLSYYFHLLIDVSPSMLTNRNAQKAIAIGYAFAHSLVRLGLPVDVSLYSSAVTRLFDHESDRLALFFGSSFGYLSSGTHEIEAIAYAKERADRVQEKTKVLVVITDGQPNVLAARRAGTNDLSSYYRDTLVPWLAGASIDLIGLSIGQSARYHPRALTLSSGWDSLPVLANLLQDIVAEGRERHSRLWA